MTGIDRRSFIAATAATAAATTRTLAAAPFACNQAPAYYRYKIGDFE